MSFSVGTGTLGRAFALSMILFVCAIALAVRILLLQTSGYENYQNKVIDQLTTESKVAAKRGAIYDRNGNLLATTVTAYRLFLSPSAIASAQKKTGETQLCDRIAKGLSNLLDMPYETILKHTTYTKLLDRTVKTGIGEEDAKNIRTWIAQENLSDLVFLEATGVRYYPYHNLAAQTIGFTSSDGSGLYGLEYQYNELLSGTPGSYITARDSLGNELPNQYEKYIAAVDGCDITTTLDLYVQSALEEQIKAAWTESGSQNRACGIAIDPSTGEILAMATYPDFDLNTPRELNEESKAELTATGLLPGTPEYAAQRSAFLLTMWSNKAVTEIYIPGSTFKIVTGSVALQEKLVTLQDNFHCPGYLKVCGITIHCHKTRGHGALNFVQGIQKSCNPVLMTVGLRIGTERFYAYFQKFGYLEKTGIDLPGEGNSLFYQPDSFTELNLATASFGQNFKISLIQQLMAVCAVANGGELLTPYLLDRAIDADGALVLQKSTQVRRRVIDSEVAAVMSSILEGGVSGDGGARNAYVPGYRVAAKTGTSEKIGDNADAYICSCVAYAPADNPKIAVIIMVDEPTIGLLYGSTVAAPYVSMFLEDTLPYLGVEPVYSETEKKELTVTVPALTGVSLSVARGYGNDLGFSIVTKGTGNTVIAQIPEAGCVMEKGGRVILLTGGEETEAGVTVPSLIGKTAMEANAILAGLGLNIRLRGISGTAGGVAVLTQSPAAGEVVPVGTVVSITFGYRTDRD